ncbi:TIGR04283 family arsenosugar biosynthesis glycosyltransferase [bacterium]|nr:TIGR04283 family arsenosugar biosynthesis glycosyltransferase [bacterium]
MKFSVIIPTLNEAKFIRTTIQHIRDLDESVEIIIADGESSDETVQLCQKAKVDVEFAKRGRGSQCNTGAAKASGDVLLFLHADTFLPENAFELMTNYFSDHNIQIGTFRLAFDSRNAMLRFYCSFTKFDSMFTRFGDQCIVIRKSFFNEIGGFPDWPLFEDVHLLRLARRRTKIISFPSKVITSARRFVARGIIRTQILNGFLLLLYLFGVSPILLANWYAVRNSEQLNLQALQKKMIRI